MKPAEPLGGLLQPAPPARELPDRDRCRREVLAAIEAERRPARPRAVTVAWLAPLGAALAVLVILTGVFVLPGLFSGAQRTGPSAVTGSRHPVASGGRHHGPWHRRTENYLVSSAVGLVEVHGDVGSVSITGEDRGTISIGAHLAYRGGAPVISRQIRRGVLGVSYRCGACRVSLDLAVPRAIKVIVNWAVGPIRLRGLAGRVSASTGTGPIRASGLTAAQAWLTTQTGSIDAGFAARPRQIWANARVGAVTIRVPAPGAYRVKASAQIGPVNVAVPQAASSGHLIQASTGAGSITIAHS